MEGQIVDHSRMTPGLSACLPELTEFSIQEINEWGRKRSGGGAESTKFSLRVPELETFTRSLNRDAKSSDGFGKCQVWERKAVVINFC